MPRNTPRLAKLSRPRLHNAVVRERLFAKLDEVRSTPAIFVVGPPGAGKTTLVASWLDARGIKGIWYQVDAGDADVASFFHYIALAAAPFEPRRAPLPLFAPEYRQELAGFARHFFRALCARLPADSVIVLDNLQDAAHASTLFHVLTVAVAELPHRANLVVISREEPPDAFARLTANRLLSMIDWDDLRLTLQETERITGARFPLLNVKAEQLHEQCQGWVAGLTLMLERVKHNDEIEAMDYPSTREAIFRYFADQIFAVAASDEQRFLLRSAFLPRATVAMAAALTGDSLAGERLESLHRRHLFTHRQEGKEPFYVYHALFRNFLFSRAETGMSPDERAELWARSGTILELASQSEDAVEAYARAERWDALQSLIERQARDLISQGRVPTLKAWIERMPRDRIAQSAWLEYWLATAIVPEDAMAAVREFDLAQTLFAEAGDTAGRVLALCGTVEAIFFATSNHAMMDAWIPLLKDLVTRMHTFPTKEVELRAYAAILIAMLFRKPDPKDLAQTAQRVAELLDSDAPANQRLTAAIFLIVYCTFTGHFDLAVVVVPKGNAIASMEGITPHARGLWAMWRCYLHQILFEFDKGMAAAREAEEIGEKYGFVQIVFFAHYFRSGIEAKAGDLVAAARSVARAVPLVDPAHKLQVALGNACSAWLAVYANRSRLALEHGRLAMAVVREIGSPSHHIDWGVPFLFGLIETGEIEEARSVLAEFHRAIDGTAIACFDPLLMCAEARIEELDGKETRTRELVRKVWSMARIGDHGRYLAWMIPWMPRFAAWALEDGIEIEYVRFLARHYRWKPPKQAPEHWPWAVKVYTLGRFEVLIDEEPIEFGRKTPKKPMALLKAIIALGGVKVSEAHVLDALWPDEEGDAAARILDITLHRLRNWLKHPEAIKQTGGKLSLNTECCWVDLWAFERGAVDDDAGRPAEVLGWYRGEFLAGETDANWAAVTRERLRARFVRCVSENGQMFEAGGRFDEALALYLRGIDADQLVEPFYQGLMRCYQRLGRVPEAISTYRRLRQTLSLTLGVPPSAASEKLYRCLQQP